MKNHYSLSKAIFSLLICNLTLNFSAQQKNDFVMKQMSLKATLINTQQGNSIEKKQFSIGSEKIHNQNLSPTIKSDINADIGNKAIAYTKCQETNNQTLGAINFEFAQQNDWTLGAETPTDDNSININSTNSSTNYFGCGFFGCSHLYPINRGLSTSATTSWLVNGKTKQVNFGFLNRYTGAIEPFDISHATNVKVRFNLAAFSSSENGGMEVGDYVRLLISIDGAAPIEIVRVTGSGPDNLDNSKVKYGFTDGGTTTASVVYPAAQSFASTETVKYSKVEVSIPNSSTIKFQIEAKNTANGGLFRNPDEFWLIDDVKITGTTATKVWDGVHWLGDNLAPIISQKALLKGDYNTAINGNLGVCSLQNNPGFTLTIAGNTYASVENDIKNDGNITVESDGNLIQNSDVGAFTGNNIKAERNVKNMNNVSPLWDYVYWSSPVTGQQIHDGTNSIFSPGTALNRNYEYRESNDYFYATPDLTFKKGKGYAIRAEAGLTNLYTKDYTFTGVPNNGIINSAETLKYTDATHGYNLVGNPYPSNMSFNKFFEANKTKIKQVAYFWTNNTPTATQSGSTYVGNNYAIYNGIGGTPATAGGTGNGDITAIPNGNVKVGQGFIVQAIAAGSNQNLVFNNAMRTYNGGTFFQKETKDRFWVSLTSPSDIVNTILIGYVPEATNDFDQDYDTPLFVESSDAIYSIVGTDKLAIQGRASFAVEDKIYLGTTQFENGDYKISLVNPEGVFSNGQKIFLKDNLLNSYTDLQTNSYTYAATKGTMEGRFEIVYIDDIVLGSANVKKDKLLVYRDANNYTIETLKNMRSVDVYDTSGRLMKLIKNADRKVQIEADSWLKGMYIFKITYEDGTIQTKKILN